MLRILGWQWDPIRVRKHVVECKVVRAKRGVESTIREGLEQIADYLDRSATDSGHLLAFDRSSAKSWSERAFRRDEEVGAKQATVWGMEARDSRRRPAPAAPPRGSLQQVPI